MASCLRRVYEEVETDERPLRDPVLVDDNEDRKFLEEIKRAFGGLLSKRHPGVPFTAAPKFRKSHADELIQLVDMVAGATGVYVDGNSEWFDLVKSKCCGVIRVP